MTTKTNIGQDPNPNRIQNEAQWWDSIFPELPAWARKEIKRLTPDDAKHFDEETILNVMATYKGVSTHENCMYILNNMETPDIIDLENKYFEHWRTLISYHKSWWLMHEEFWEKLKMKRREREVFADFPENKVYKPDFIKKHDATRLFRETLHECAESIFMAQQVNPFWWGKLIYGVRTWWKRNIKYVENYQKLTFNNFYESGGYEYFVNWIKKESYWWCKVFIEWIEMQLSELWNFLVGFNWYLSRSAKDIKLLYIPWIDVYDNWVYVERSNYEYELRNEKGYTSDKELTEEDKKIINFRAEQDEKQDRPWYDAGYEYWKVQYPVRDILDVHIFNLWWIIDFLLSSDYKSLKPYLIQAKKEKNG